jgi:hypothetical protein
MVSFADGDAQVYAGTDGNRKRSGLQRRVACDRSQTSNFGSAEILCMCSAAFLVPTGECHPPLCVANGN